jgi:hypothetical protein
MKQYRHKNKSRRKSAFQVDKIKVPILVAPLTPKEYKESLIDGFK